MSEEYRLDKLPMYWNEFTSTLSPETRVPPIATYSGTFDGKELTYMVTGKFDPQENYIRLIFGKKGENPHFGMKFCFDEKNLEQLTMLTDWNGKDFGYSGEFESNPQDIGIQLLQNRDLGYSLALIKFIRVYFDQTMETATSPN